MDALGSVSQIYMFVLLALLFVGSGLAVWSFIHFLADRVKRSESMKKEKQVNLNNGPAQESGSDKKIFGGLKMANNGWLKLAVFSLVGILISVFALGFVTTSSADAMNTMSMAGNSMTNSSTHSQHQQQGMNTQVQDNMGNMQMQGNVNGNMGTQMQGNMNGNMGYQMQGNMNGNMGYQMQGNMNGMIGQQPGNDYMMMQQQLNQMQMQLNQIQQQQMYNMNNNMQMQSGGMNNMQSNGMNNMQSGGMGMGMMNMGGMNNMQQGNMNQNSSGGMSMM